MNDNRWLRLGSLVVVAVAATLTAGLAYREFRPNVDHLFWDLTHDRNAHYNQGLSMALNIRSGDIAGLAKDIDSCRVWGVLHPLAVAAVQLIGGPDVRLGVVPSLLGWIATAIFAFLICRRVLPAGGEWAGLIAAAFVLVSPAHRAYACEIMLESGGSGLTLAALYAYLVWVQEPSRRSAGWLALAWSALFFDKYNYWLLVTAGMTLSEMTRHPMAARQLAIDLARRTPAFLRRHLRNPFSLAAVALTAVGLVIAATGGGVLNLAGRPVSFRNPHNLVHIAYLLVFGQLVFWWMRGGREQLAMWRPEHRVLVYGHAVPILFWFALPKRLFNFFWFLSPANADHVTAGFATRLTRYWSAAQADYHVDPLLLPVILVGVALAVVWIRSLRPGSAALLFVVGVSAYLTIQHPMTKDRFLHSWIACLWVVGAVGLVRTLCGRTFPTCANTISSPRTRLAMAVPMTASLAFVVFLARGWNQRGHAQEGGMRLGQLSTLPLSRAYLPDLAQAKNVAILCNVQTSFELRWTYMEAFRRTRGLVLDIKGDDTTSPDRTAFLSNWLATTKTDTIVLLDVPPTSPRYTKTALEVDLGPIAESLKQQSRFTSTRTIHFEEGETIQIWTRTSP